MLFCRLMLLLALLFAPLKAVSGDHLVLILPDFKPYTYLEQGEFKGIGVDKVRQILDKTETPYEFRLAPNYGRAVEELKNHRVDGLFLASENDERNAVAQFSDSVVINRWSWFMHKGVRLMPDETGFKEQISIATHLNTNTHKWLKKNNYLVGFAPADLNILPRVLLNRRVGAVFLAEAVFLKACEDQGIDPRSFTQIVEIAKPFGIYIHKAYLENNPEFMGKLNQAIQQTSELAGGR